jgi:hypothetical protein
MFLAATARHQAVAVDERLHLVNPNAGSSLAHMASKLKDTLRNIEAVEP